MDKLFGKLNMTWGNVCIFAVIAGLYTGTIMLFPSLIDTSFQDIGVMYEWWILFAVIVTSNCEKSTEAMLKCFVFFLISQPLIYAVEIVFGRLSLEMGLRYYIRIWGPVSLLTLPGGYVAFYGKKQNIIGSIIIGIGCAMDMLLAVFYFGNMVKSFPNHLFSGFFCLVSVVMMTFGIQRERRYRIAALAIGVTLTAAVIVYARNKGMYLF